jgi:chromosome partitioning protein
MITIAIATHKGGTGKTVTAMALAAAFARDGLATVLVDLDPQGHSTRGLGVDVGVGQPTLRELLRDPARPLDEILVTTTIGGGGRPTYDHGAGDSPVRPCPICQAAAALRPLRVLPADIGAERDAQTLYVRPKREQVLQRALVRLTPAPAVVVVDCPPSLGALTENGIAAADLVLAPCQMEARTADAVADLLELVAVLKNRDGAPPFDDWRLVYTRYDARKAVTNRAIAAALEAYVDHTLETRIPQNEALNQAQIEQVDIFTYAPASKGAVAYRELAHEVGALIDRVDDARRQVAL